MAEKRQPYLPLPPVPEGMSKSQWKKQWKRIRFEQNKEEYNKIRKEKRLKAKEARRSKIQAFLERGEEIPAELKKPVKQNLNQTDSGIRIILDCAFDDLMNEKEITSLSNQITRAYSSNRREAHYAEVIVTSFNKRLQRRFDEGLKGCNYTQWNHFRFVEDEEGFLTGDQIDKSKMVYLTADTEEKLETLEPGMTYIVGGIVDKNRHKALCYNKARQLNIPTKRLPIGEYIELAGRKVLTTTHVVQLLLKYFDHHDWKEAFEEVLPQRKLETGKNAQKTTEAKEEDPQ